MIIVLDKSKVKVNFALQGAIKAQRRRSRDITLLLL
jgi:hypothetical protein